MSSNKIFVCIEVTRVADEEEEEVEKVHGMTSLINKILSTVTWTEENKEHHENIIVPRKLEKQENKQESWHIFHFV